MSDTWSWQFNPLLRPVETYDAPGEHRFFLPQVTQNAGAVVPYNPNELWPGDGDWTPTSVGRGALTSTGDSNRDFEMMVNDRGTMNALSSLASGPVGLLSIALGTALNQAAGVPGINSLGGFMMDRAREMGLTPEQIRNLREAQRGQYQTQRRLSDDRETRREDLAPINNTVNQNITSFSNPDVLNTPTSTKTLTDLGNVVNPNITSLLDVYAGDGGDTTGATGTGTTGAASSNTTGAATSSMSQEAIDAMNAESDALEAQTQMNLDTLASIAAQIADVQSQKAATEADISDEEAATAAQASLDKAVADMVAALETNVATAPAAPASETDEDTDDEAAAQSVADAMAEAQAAADAEAAAEAAAAADAAASDAGEGEGDGDGDGDGDGGDGSGDGGGDGGDGGGDGGYRKGGLVKGKKKNAPVKTTVHVGEYVMRPEAVNMYGLGLLNAINEQRIPKRRFTGLLGD